MAHQQADHAKKVVDRFVEMIGPELTAQLSDDHLAELSLLVESAIDAAVLDTEESVISQLESLTNSIRRDADFFED